MHAYTCRESAREHYHYTNNEMRAFWCLAALSPRCQRAREVNARVDRIVYTLRSMCIDGMEWFQVCSVGNVINSNPKTTDAHADALHVERRILFGFRNQFLEHVHAYALPMCVYVCMVMIGDIMKEGAFSRCLMMRLHSFHRKSASLRIEEEGIFGNLNRRWISPKKPKWSVNIVSRRDLSTVTIH